MACTSVPTENLSQLIDKLASGLPYSNSVRVMAKRVRAGELRANFYTDGWPDFTTVVCHRLPPAISEEGDILASAHSTSKERLLQVILESGVVGWIEQCFRAGFDVANGDHIIKGLKRSPGNEDKSIWSVQATRYYLPLGALEGRASKACPNGFFLGKLSPQHTAFVVDHWPSSELKDRSRMLAYFESVIRKFHTVAVFQTTNPEKPVAWVLQWAHGELGHLYVLQEFRGKGLSLLCLREVCQRITEEGDVPEALILDNNPIAFRVFRKVGFIEMHQETLFVTGKWSTSHN